MFDFRAVGCHTKKEENAFSWGFAQSLVNGWFRRANEGENIFDPCDNLDHYPKIESAFNEAKREWKNGEYASSLADLMNLGLVCDLKLKRIPMCILDWSFRSLMLIGQYTMAFYVAFNVLRYIEQRADEPFIQVYHERFNDYFQYLSRTAQIGAETDDPEPMKIYVLYVWMCGLDGPKPDFNPNGYYRRAVLNQYGDYEWKFFSTNSLPFPQSEEEILNSCRWIWAQFSK